MNLHRRFRDMKTCGTYRYIVYYGSSIMASFVLEEDAIEFAKRKELYPEFKKKWIVKDLEDKVVYPK